MDVVIVLLATGFRPSLEKSTKQQKANLCKSPTIEECVALKSFHVSRLCAAHNVIRSMS